MRRLSAAEVHAQKVVELGLDPAALDLTSIEAISGALRRVAGLLCPCPSATLVRGVLRPLRGLVDDLESLKVTVEDTLEALVAHGDILEAREVREEQAGESATLLYAAPPSFVMRKSGTAILLGVTSDQLSALPEELEHQVEYVNHVRRLSARMGEDLRADLVQLGLVELSYERWLKAPTDEAAPRHVARVDGLLNDAEPSRDVPGLLSLDAERPVRYYRGRWVEPRTQSGRFVARRSQAFGAQLWCYVQLRKGSPERLVDFPIGRSKWRGCDEAWRLQMAIDAQRGEPQQFALRPGPQRTQVLQLFSPVPMWARRRWDAVGEPIQSSGCLFAYRLAASEVDEEVRFARDVLWLQEVRDHGAHMKGV
jgi:hypothetical protein